MKREYKKPWITVLCMEEDIIVTSSDLDGECNKDDVGIWEGGW